MIDLRRGIPLEIRGEIWLAMIGNKQRITAKNYNVLIQRSKVMITKIETESYEGDKHLNNLRKGLDVIDKDLNRMYADLGSYKKGGYLN